MPTNQKKVIFYAPPDIERWLAEESARTGAPVAELCRRAIRLAAYGEVMTSNQAGYIRSRQSLEDYEARQKQARQSVLIATPKAGE
jgi:hypothetical protein